MSTTTEPDKWLSTDEVAELFNVSKHSVWQWNKDGRGPARYRLGRVNRYRLSDCLAWAESRKVPA
jgi:excisionase family DNA binding protein